MAAKYLYKVNDAWISVVAILFITLLSMLAYDLVGVFVNGNKWREVLYFLVYNTIYWMVNRTIILFIYKRLPRGVSMKKRLVIIFLFCYPATVILRMTGTYARQYLFNYNIPSFWIMLQIIALVVLGTVWVVIATYDILYSNAETGKEEEEKQALIRADIQSRYDSLKGQINPHFLFNNLNSLSTLISKDAMQADTFVGEMSSVYRYLLKNTEETLASLGDEIKFARSYQYLLKTRFGDGFEPVTDIDAQYLTYRIPALSIQLLMENAVKYNIVSPEEPLKLSMRVKDKRLIISNNLQRKMQAVESEGFGLSTIILRYKLLNESGVEISETGGNFIVSLPLIKP